MEKKSFYEKFIESLDRQIIDKDDIKKSFIAQAKSNLLLQKIFDTLDEGIILCNIIGYPLFYNKKALVVFEQLKKVNFLSLIPPELQDQFYQALQGKKPVDIITPLKILNNSYFLKFTFEKIKLPLEEDDEAVLVVFYDINAQIKEEREKQIQESFANLMEMLYTIAHEIRNPLTSLDLNIKIAQKQLEKTEDKCKCNNCYQQLLSSLNTTATEIVRLNKILDNFLTTAKPIQPKLQVINLNEIVKELSSIVNSQFQLSGKILILKLKEDISPILADKDLLKQALLNLIKNAFEAIDKGGIVTVSTYDREDNVIVEVKDNGTGMDLETLDKIFTPFFTSKSTGTGLGLTIVYRIVQSLFAEIKVESKKNYGTTFQIIFDKNKVKHALLDNLSKYNDTPIK
jgi:signal transduction histidine kinase